MGVKEDLLEEEPVEPGLLRKNFRLLLENFTVRDIARMWEEIKEGQHNGKTYKRREEKTFSCPECGSWEVELRVKNDNYFLSCPDCRWSSELGSFAKLAKKYGLPITGKRI